MSFNLFDWIRAGVKQAILLGVSDAADTIGTPAEVDEVNQQLFTALRQSPTTAIAGSTAAGSKNQAKLGRSLKQMMDQPETPKEPETAGAKQAS